MQTFHKPTGCPVLAGNRGRKTNRWRTQLPLPYSGTMSTIKERLRGVEVELKSLRRELTEFKSNTGKQFETVFSKIDEIARTLMKLNPKSHLSGRDKALIIASLITASASIIVALVK